MAQDLDDVLVSSIEEENFDLPDNPQGEEPVKAETAKGNFPTDSCGVCPSCVKASQLIHPDIHFSYPVIPRKSGDKPISTDYLSEWREFMKQFPADNLVADEPQKSLLT